MGSKTRSEVQRTLYDESNIIPKCVPNDQSFEYLRPRKVHSLHAHCGPSSEEEVDVGGGGAARAGRGGGGRGGGGVRPGVAVAAGVSSRTASFSATRLS